MPLVMPYCLIGERPGQGSPDRRSRGIERDTTDGRCLPEEASPEDLLPFVQDHWGIENKVHWVRHMTFDRDRSKVRTGNGPQTMATLRNLAVSRLHLNGHRNLAQATRYYNAHRHAVLNLIGA